MGLWEEDDVPQLSQGSNGHPSAEVACGGADAVPETPNAAPSGAVLEGENASAREQGIMAMRREIRTGRWLLALASLVFVVGLTGWVFWFFFWPA